MPNKEAALDALQTIINLTSTHMGSKVNDQIIAQSETIRKALVKLPEEPIDGVRVSCIQIGMIGHTTPISEVQAYYSEYDALCINCGGRCQ